MTITSHRGKVIVDHGEPLVAFELAVDSNASGSFQKAHGITNLYSLPASDPRRYYADFAVSYAIHTSSQTLHTSFGVEMNWTNHTGYPAYLSVFRGYQHARKDLPAHRSQIVSYYVMVANEDKPNPEEAATAIPQTSAKLMIDLNGIVAEAELPYIMLHFAPIVRDSTEPSSIVHFQLQGTKLVVDHSDNSFRTGAYTVTRPTRVQQAYEAHHDEYDM